MSALLPNSPRQVIAVWFSCGAASAVAAKLTLDLYGAYHDVRIVNNPVAEEDEDNRRFLHDVEKWLGVEIEIATCAKYPNASAVEVWEREKFISGPEGAPCTKFLKKRARQEWQMRNPVDWHVFGFGDEERKRYENFIISELPNVLPVLIDHGITRQGAYNYLLAVGIEPPRTYEMGYPNGNCIGCGKATSPTYWNHVRKMHPHVFNDRATQSRRIGAKLVRVKGERIFLDELDPKARGRSMKSMKIDCGIFCEENDHIPKEKP